MLEKALYGSKSYWSWIFGLLVVFSGFGALIVWVGQRLGRRPAFAGGDA